MPSCNWSLPSAQTKTTYWRPLPHILQPQQGSAISQDLSHLAESHHCNTSVFLSAHFSLPYFVPPCYSPEPHTFPLSPFPPVTFPPLSSCNTSPIKPDLENTTYFILTYIRHIFQTLSLLRSMFPITSAYSGILIM